MPLQEKVKRNQILVVHGSEPDEFANQMTVFCKNSAARQSRNCPSLPDTHFDDESVLLPSMDQLLFGICSLRRSSSSVSASFLPLRSILPLRIASSSHLCNL